MLLILVVALDFLLARLEPLTLKVEAEVRNLLEALGPQQTPWGLMMALADF